MKSPIGYTRLMLGLAIGGVFFMIPAAHAQVDPATLLPVDPTATSPAQPLLYVIPLGTQTSTLYYDNSEIEIATEERWRLMSGSNPTNFTLDDLQRIATNHNQAFENGPAVIIDRGVRGSGLNIVYNCDSTVPTEALAAFAIAEEYLESLFSDNITITMTCSFASLGESILGATNSTYVSNVTYAMSRSGLQYGMDTDDVIQTWLPSGNTVPVRYNGSTTTVTNENRIDWTKGNYKATIGSAIGSDAGMAYNSDTTWDYDPTNGIGWVRISFVDVVCHETGHALGFVSGADSGDHMEALDLYRFCRQDGSANYNPDTYEDFQTTPRILCYNNPDDQQNTDLIDVTYRMEDGSPWQASHLRMDNDYGCMCPAIGTGSTRYPDYYTQADIDCFDAIGYDYPACESAYFTEQPTSSQTVCLNEDVTLSVTVDLSTVTYQWRKGANALVDDGVHIVGATTNSLTILGITEADASSYYACFVQNTADDCPAFSDYAEILVDATAPTFTSHPADMETTAGEFAYFMTAVDNATFVDFRWEKDGVPLTDDGRINGATTTTLLITSTLLSDAGEYACVATSQVGLLCSAASNAATLTVHPNGQGCPNAGDSGNYCTGDIDGSGDCMVTLADLAQLLSNYGTASGATPDQGDIEPAGGDGDIDLADLASLLTQYGDDCN